MADLITADEYLIIDTVPLATPAWRILDLTPLWTSADQIGSDRKLPGVNGSRAYRRYKTATQLVFSGKCWGARDREGTYYGDAREGLHANMAVLLGLTEPVASDTGTRAATWVVPGTDKTADIHVLGLEPRAKTPVEVMFSLTISIPAGRFA